MKEPRADYSGFIFYNPIKLNAVLYSICYVSSANNLSANSLEKLFFETEQNNSRLNMSGLLIYNNGNFLQILEGENVHINNLFSKIKKDDRHRSIIKLIDTPIEERVFDNYNVGFLIVNDLKKQKTLEDYLNWLKQAEIESVDKVVGIIENFINNKYTNSTN